MPEYDTDKLWGKLVLLDRRSTPPTMSYWDETTQSFIMINPPVPIYAPLCTGDLVPQLIGTGDGQTVLVQVA